MKRSEAIDLLNNLIGVIEDNHNSDYDMALLIGIKAIEQEPFINKPCMSRGLCDHDKNVVLDKVRAEIKALSPEATVVDEVDGNPIKDAVWETLADVLQIIDKYRKDRSDKE